jgi:hypothetical protein
VSMSCSSIQEDAFVVLIAHTLWLIDRAKPRAQSEEFSREWQLEGQ